MHTRTVATGFRHCLLLSLLLATGLASTAARAQRLLYSVDLKTAKDHYVNVVLRPMQLRPDTLTFQMPVWAPGVYSEVHYGRFIKDFKALDKSGKELRVVRVNDDRWKVVNAENIGEIRYRVQQSADEKNAPLTGLAKFTNDIVLANSVALFGYVSDDKNIPITLSFSLPPNWMIATPLEVATEAATVSVQSRLHQTIYSVDDYETLADAPILAAPNAKKVLIWKDAGREYFVVNAGDAQFPIDSFALDAKRIVRSEIAFFKNSPFSQYMFLVYGTSGGTPVTVAHQSSGLFVLPTKSWTSMKDETRHILASTLFQTWNGKRFHISPLGPVDFTTPIAARSLWFNEGVSDYYADLLLARSGLTPPGYFFGAIDRWKETATQRTSLEELSSKMGSYNGDLWQTLRNKGALTALLLDLDIRQKTKNRSSLDKVLAKMNLDGNTGKTYDDKTLLQTVAEYSGTDLTNFYSRYVAGNDTLPVDFYLNVMGVSCEVPVGLPPVTVSTAPAAVVPPITFTLLKNGSATVATAPADTMVLRAAIRVGDTVRRINGSKPTAGVVQRFQEMLARGEEVRLEIVHSNQSQIYAFRVLPNKGPVRRVPTMVMKEPTKDQIAMQKAMLGRRLPVPPVETDVTPKKS